jgi:hypothetical protein
MQTLFSFICTPQGTHYSTPLKVGEETEARKTLFRMSQLSHYAEIINFKLVSDKYGHRWVCDTLVQKPNEFIKEFLRRNTRHALVYRYRSEITQAEGLWE